MNLEAMITLVNMLLNLNEVFLLVKFYYYRTYYLRYITGVNLSKISKSSELFGSPNFSLLMGLFDHGESINKLLQLRETPIHFSWFIFTVLLVNFL